MSGLTKLTVTQASDLLSKGEISSLDITTDYLEKIKLSDVEFGAYITVTDELAFEQAKKADAKLLSGDAVPLTGIPMQLKDNLSTKDVKTTCASKVLEDFVPVYNATVVEKLYSSGAVLLGKGNLDEFAMGSSNENSAFFHVKNPWDVERVPGGSSGGPAVSVASGEAAYALGSDTGGSIRQPASFCGIVGLKPTYGLVSRFGLVAFASSLDQVGPLTINVSDCAEVLNVISGYDPLDSTSISNSRPDYKMSLRGDLKGLKIGIPKEYFPAEMDTEVSTIVKNAIKSLEALGADVEEISLPSTPNALAVYYLIAPSEASANLGRYDGVKYGFSNQDDLDFWGSLELTRDQSFGPEVKRRIMLGTYALSSGYYDAYYLKAQKVRTLIIQEFKSVFERFDAIVTPTTPTTAFKFGEKIDDPLKMYLNDIFTMPANIAGIPAISVPCGISGGMPVGLQIMGDAMMEEKILKIAFAYEQANEWSNFVPKMK